MPRSIARPSGGDLCQLFQRGMREPLIVERVDKILKLDDGIEAFSSVARLRHLTEGSSDTVGVVVAGSVPSVCSELPLTEALEHLAVYGGCINGWEYLAGDQREKFLPVTAGFEKIINPKSLLYDLPTVTSKMLDAVMKWVFIGGCKGEFGEPSCVYDESTPTCMFGGSDWHTDPIGSAAWMVQLVGTKKWSVKLANSEIVVGTLSPLDLLILPPGLEHKVENIQCGGSPDNVAITHNWVDIENCSQMWLEVEKGVEIIEKISPPENVPTVAQKLINDNLLYGLIVVLTSIPKPQLEELVDKHFAARKISDKKLLLVRLENVAQLLTQPPSIHN